MGMADQHRRDNYFIRQHDFADTFRIAEQLLGDREDLIHRAVGWMLREVGKKDMPMLEPFLRRHGKVMPRTSTPLCHRTIPGRDAARLLTGTFMIEASRNAHGSDQTARVRQAARASALFSPLHDSGCHGTLSPRRRPGSWPCDFTPLLLLQFELITLPTFPRLWLTAYRYLVVVMPLALAWSFAGFLLALRRPRFPLRRLRSGSRVL